MEKQGRNKRMLKPLNNHLIRNLCVSAGKSSIVILPDHVPINSRVRSVLKRIFITKKNLALITLHTNLTAMKPHFFFTWIHDCGRGLNKGLSGVITVTVDG